METEFRNVTITVSADTPEDAYCQLVDALMDALAVQRKGARVEMERANVPEWMVFEDDEA